MTSWEEIRNRVLPEIGRHLTLMVQLPLRKSPRSSLRLKVDHDYYLSSESVQEDSACVEQFAPRKPQWRMYPCEKGKEGGGGDGGEGGSRRDWRWLSRGGRCRGDVGDEKKVI